MENLPFYPGLIFELTVLLSLWLFYKAANKSNKFLALALSWIVIQSLISLTGFYKVTNSFPPRFPLLLLPPLLVIILLFITASGRKFIDQLDVSELTLFQIIRIPVEIVLLLLCLNKVVPQLMTFEGRNFDILSGISAPVIYYLGFKRRKLSNTVIIIWNMICLALVINIAVNALLSAPTPFQKFAFDQPNVAIFRFPFIFLPGLLVPMVIFSHLVVIRRIIINRGTLL